MTTIKRTLHSAHGFITAFWASFGVAILAAAAVDGDALSFMADGWLMAVMFVAATYTSSYFVGMRAFAFERVKTNPFLSILVAFVVSEVVLGLGVLAGGTGHVILESIRDGRLAGEPGANVLVAPLAFMMYGVMFTGPLSIGLGLNIWIRERMRRTH